MTDLQEERKVVADAIEELGAEPVWFEKFGGRDADPEDAYVAEVITINRLRRNSGAPVREAAVQPVLSHTRRVQRGRRIGTPHFGLDDIATEDRMATRSLSFKKSGHSTPRAHSMAPPTWPKASCPCCHLDRLSDW